MEAAADEGVKGHHDLLSKVTKTFCESCVLKLVFLEEFSKWDVVKTGLSAN
jgi:hypothetical protein